jgi:predicted nucleotide-binding protein (sugar kinase/HSP70/actin superfamily)
MNKASIRAFAFGILLATSAIGSVYYLSQPLQLTENEVSSYLQKNALIAVSVKEYEQLQELKKNEQQEREKKQTNQQNSQPQEDRQGIIEKTVYAYRLVISRGKTPTDISRELEEAKVINDAASFTRYLEKHNLTRKIRIGTYNVNSNMSNEELSRIITSRQ